MMGDKCQIAMPAPQTPEGLGYQIASLGFMAQEHLRGAACMADTPSDKGENMRRNLEEIGRCIQVWCFGLCCQAEMDSEHLPAKLASAVFMLTALGNHAVKQLSAGQIAMQGGLDSQRAYALQVGESVRDACNSVFDLIHQNPTRGQFNE